MPSLLTDSPGGTVIKCKSATITRTFLRNSPVRGYAKLARSKIQIALLINRGGGEGERRMLREFHFPRGNNSRVSLFCCAIRLRAKETGMSALRL